MLYLKNHVKRVINSESGTFTVEALFWFALMILMTGLVVDSSNTFYSYSYVNRSIQDGHRQMSVGRFKTAAETEAFIESQIQDIYPTADATVQIDGNMVVTSVEIPWASLRMMGILASSQSAPVSFTGSHRLEWMP